MGRGAVVSWFLVVAGCLACSLCDDVAVIVAFNQPELLGAGAAHEGSLFLQVTCPDSRIGF
jgi:hypothetical protein